MGEHASDYGRVKKPVEEIRPCVCATKVNGTHNGCYFGMPVLTPCRNDYSRKVGRLFWKIECPSCGRGGCTEFNSVNAALNYWNRMQDSLLKGPEGLDLPWAYPIGEEDVYEPLFARYKELIQEIGYGYLLELPPDEKAPLMRRTGLQEKIDLMETVLRTKRERQEEFERMYEEVEGDPDDETGVTK